MSTFGQYQYSSSDYSSGNEIKFMDNIKSGKIIGTDIISNKIYRDFTFQRTDTTKFKSKSSYYVHFSVEKQTYDQNFILYLANSESTENETQQIKSINVSKKASTETVAVWEDFEIVFNPFQDNFNQIIFYLNIDRTLVNKKTNIVIKEVAEVMDKLNNFISDSTNNSSDLALVKLGIISKPYFSMVINNEPIRCSRSGLFEINNGYVLVTSFGVYCAGDTGIVKGYPEEGPDISAGTVEDDSAWLWINSDFTHNISDFTLDYITK